MSYEKEKLDRVRYNVNRFYYDEYRVRFVDRSDYVFLKDNDPRKIKEYREEGLNIYQNNNGRLDGSRHHDPIYNDKSKFQIHTFGCSWTYGWDLKPEETFTHLLGDKNTSVFNHGAGGTGLDFAVKKLSEVYEKYNHRENQNFVYIITIPHTFRRMWFDTDGVALKAWKAPDDSLIANEYNVYLNFIHHYEMVNRFVGKDKVLWATWGEHFDAMSDVPDDMIEIKLDCVDYTVSNHPGPESNKLYAEKIKDVLQDRFK
tara:strand:- start:2331 stop:3104 length:774 start_codon:yes stop_codon:yes gene_type:complete